MAGHLKTVSPAGDWSRVRHVTVGADSVQRRSSLFPLLSAGLLLVAAVVMLTRSDGGGIEMVQMMSKVAGGKGPVLSVASHSSLDAAEAKGLVQKVRADSKAQALKNVATHALAAMPAGAPAKVAASGKVAAGKSSADIKAAAQAMAKTHMLEEASGQEENERPTFLTAYKDMLEQKNGDATPAEKDQALVVGSPDKNPDKVLVKMYMESKCPACRKFSTTYVKEMLEAKGVGDVVDFEYVAWGWGQIESAPTEKQLELNPKADYSNNLLNHTSQLMPILNQYKALKDPKVGMKIPNLVYNCQHGFAECEGNAWEACLQDIAPSHKDFFPVFDCVEARSCPEGAKPPECVDTPANVMQGCLEEYGKHINTPELLNCYHSTRMRELLVINDIATLEAKPQWVPWFTIDGVDLVQDPTATNTTASFREQFLLGKAVCEAYVAKTGKEAPPGCATFPQSDEQLGVDPWLRFPKFNFTSLIVINQSLS